MTYKGYEIEKEGDHYVVKKDGEIHSREYTVEDAKEEIDTLTENE